jgi:hypothetical protein
MLYMILEGEPLVKRGYSAEAFKEVMYKFE